MPYPEPISQKKKVTKSGQLKYFVLTSQEAHAAKLKYHQDKLQREKEKLERKQQRELNAMKKQQEKTVKASIAQQRKLENKTTKQKPKKVRTKASGSDKSQGGACTCCGKMYGADDDDKKKEEFQLHSQQFVHQRSPSQSQLWNCAPT